MVTSKGVGLAVPDWPTTFGYNMFLFPVSKWVGGILFEHTHRLIASAVGFLTIILTIWIWRGESRHWVRNLGVIALAGVIFQGILGGLRVTMLKDEIGIFHACIAQAFLALLVVIALVTSKFWRRLSNAVVDTKNIGSITTLAIAITLAIYIQLALGSTMRHEHRDLAILDFPTANGAWIPDTSATTLANITANDTPVSRAADCSRSHCVCASPLERCASGSRAQAIVDVVDRISFRSIDARSVDNLEQQSRRYRDRTCRSGRDHAIFWREYLGYLLANFASWDS